MCVVHHQMLVLLGWHVGLDRAQELEEFTAAMTSMQFANDFARGNVQRREQCGRAVAHIVVRASLRDARGRGSMGCVRSSAWIWLFSSTHKTMAFSGGSRYSPTISRTLSTKNGSVESLKVSCRRLQSESTPDPRHGCLRHPPSCACSSESRPWVRRRELESHRSTGVHVRRTTMGTRAIPHCSTGRWVQV